MISFMMFLNMHRLITMSCTCIYIKIFIIYTFSVRKQTRNIFWKTTTTTNKKTTRPFVFTFPQNPIETAHPKRRCFSMWSTLSLQGWSLACTARRWMSWSSGSTKKATIFYRCLMSVYRLFKGVYSFFLIGFLGLFQSWSFFPCTPWKINLEP